MEKLYAYTMVSRHKDNRDVPGFIPRSRVYLSYESDEAEVLEKFVRFAADGLPNEKSRLYKTVNARDENKTKRAFLAKVITDDIPVVKINRALASTSMLAENRAESKWMFDFDETNEKLLSDFVDRIVFYSGDISKTDILVQKTPNGYVIVVPHGFDTRKLMEEFTDADITLKRDGSLFVSMIENNK